MFDWTQHFADWLTYNMFGLVKGNHFADALNFFVFDTIKIFILLFFIFLEENDSVDHLLLKP